MRDVQEFRDPKAAQGVLRAIEAVCTEIGCTADDPLRIMEISGGHIHAIFRCALDKLVPAGIEFIPGPGCPVCVLPPIRALLEDPHMTLDGVVGPGHVSMLTGIHCYDFVAQDFGKPVVVAGYKPLDLLKSVLMVLRQIAEGRAEVENQYARVVPEHGTPVSLAAIADAYGPRPSFDWRALARSTPLACVSTSAIVRETPRPNSASATAREPRWQSLRAAPAAR